MLKILKNLKKSFWSVVVIILLLVVQAQADLRLPDFTSRIVNVGIQAGGIENAVPYVISKEDMENILIFSNEDDEILENYSLVGNNISKEQQKIIDNYLGKNSIATLTIHKSKGLEYNSVYFIGLEDSAFWSFSKQPESDRKAFFVAISRAKEKLYFTFCRGRQTGRNFYQTKDTINEFYELFKKSGIVKNIKQL